VVQKSGNANPHAKIERGQSDSPFVQLEIVKPAVFDPSAGIRGVEVHATWRQFSTVLDQYLDWVNFGLWAAAVIRGGDTHGLVKQANENYPGFDRFHSSLRQPIEDTLAEYVGEVIFPEQRKDWLPFVKAYASIDLRLARAWTLWHRHARGIDLSWSAWQDQAASLVRLDPSCAKLQPLLDCVSKLGGEGAAVGRLLDAMILALWADSLTAASSGSSRALGTAAVDSAQTMEDQNIREHYAAIAYFVLTHPKYVAAQRYAARCINTGRHPGSFRKWCSALDLCHYCLHRS